MALLKKKSDPITDRARVLNDQIAALKSQIQQLDTQIQRTPTPRWRSTALPPGMTVPHTPEPTPKPAVREPVFEEINQEPLPSRTETESADHYNELGVRKYDLPALWQRLGNYFRGPTTANPRLVKYLGAGNVHGLRPMRYEKRVARNRLIALVILLVVVLCGLLSFLLRGH